MVALSPQDGQPGKVRIDQTVPKRTAGGRRSVEIVALLDHATIGMRTIRADTGKLMHDGITGPIRIEAEQHPVVIRAPKGRRAVKLGTRQQQAAIRIGAIAPSTTDPCQD